MCYFKTILINQATKIYFNVKWMDANVRLVTTLSNTATHELNILYHAGKCYFLHIDINCVTRYE